jgi:signal transduction histidine kinase
LVENADSIGSPALVRTFVAWLRGLPTVAVDVTVAGAVAVGTVGPALVYPGRSWWVVVLAVLASVPLVWRRRATIPVTLVVGAATVVLVSLDSPPPVFMAYGSLVCTYTFASLSPPVWRLLAVLATAVGVVASISVPAVDPVYYAYVGMAQAAAYALGTATRARRAQAAMLRERARRLAEERAGAVARERARIARDLHDIVTHSVGVMVVQAEAGAVVVRGDPGRAEAAFEAISQTGRDAVGQLRRALGALRSGEPAVREPQPGIDAVAGLAERARLAGLDVAVEQHGQARPVPADVEVAAYRIIQESLTNTLRHAAASAVRVRLRWSETTLKIQVTDDGRGSSPAIVGGHGLIGMRERAVACGGTLATGPAAGGGGFTVTATLPVG